MTQRIISLLVFSLSIFGLGLPQVGNLNAQSETELTYYLPDLEYDPAIPAPESFLGWSVGEWHISHDLQYHYLKAVAAASDRMILQEYGRSYEARPLIHLIVTSPENHARLDELRQLHLDYAHHKTDTDVSEVPGVLYQGYNIHGNEPSGGNAAILVAYYLAAAPVSEVEKLLDENIILLDPCMNPDGFNRFASWVNQHKAENLTPDGQDREYNEEWPRGRTNHYWFDLNRDWMPVQHPESQGRVHAFQNWRPNVLTDHHEMGTNATFFFMPGEPTRVYPTTPAINQELTARIGEYHARALDQIGSLYYSGEGYDDYYVGKGSTYPDAQGTVGILFEQASSRGHLQESENGLLSFPFTIRNQVVASLSTQAAFVDLREDLLKYQREVFDPTNRPKGGYLIQNEGDISRGHEMVNLLTQHRIEIQQVGNDNEPSAYYIDLDQPQHNLITALFETISEFEDSLFYDVSTWTLPYAFNLPTERLNSAPAGLSPLKENGTGDRANPGFSQYAYLLPWDDYYAAKATYSLMAEGLRLKVSSLPFTDSEGRQYEAGTILIPVANQGGRSAQEIRELIVEINFDHNAGIVATNSGDTDKGLMLGSRSAWRTMRMPSVAVLVDGGVSSYDAGEVWHLLDQRLGMPCTKLSVDEVAYADLSRYNTLIMVDGNYSELGVNGIQAIRDWMSYGNVLITEKRAGSWAAANGLADLVVASGYSSSSDDSRRPYQLRDRDRGSRVLGGAIFEAKGDLTNPLLFGFRREEVPIFKRGLLRFELPSNPYASPLTFGEGSLLSGYSPRGFEENLSNTAAIVVSSVSGGRTISFADNPNFRAFWFGNNRLFFNALFFGSTIDASATE
ncbi:MAG: M14 family zinc carboxypeptidase [Bacteroidota bacterium]